MKASRLKAGQVLKLHDEPWLVVKAKRKGDAVKLTVKHPKKGEHTSTLGAKTKLELWPALPLHGESGEQQRWAKQREAADAPAPAQVVADPPKATQTPWETPADRIEEKLDNILGARLVAQSDDGARSYYVPPVDVSTIATHLVLFHAKDAEHSAELMQLSEAEMMQRHEQLDAAIPHTHTETRPAP